FGTLVRHHSLPNSLIVGYFIDWKSLTPGETGWINLAMVHLPLLFTLLYLPLAHWCQSRVLYGLWAVGFATIFFGSRDPAAAWTTSPAPIAMAWALTLPPALLWAYHANLWSALRSTLRSTLRLRLFPRSSVPLAGPKGRQSRDPFQAIGQSISCWWISLITYWFSFRWLWQMDRWLGVERNLQNPHLAWLSLSFLAYFILTLLAWGHLIHRRQPVPKALWLNSRSLLGLLGLQWGVVFFHLQGATLSRVGPVAMNSILFFLAFALLHDGLLLGIRHRFWGGMSLLVLGIISRMFEYNTGLILKAIVLILCGIGVIAAGLWFEAQSRSSHSPPALLPER
ncbi:hypothetical protein QQ91_0001200, partial [Lyngbya confervoides BDU141951]|nr:hypothetical protein [Lyngbya confervoides BDU141951]